MDDLEPQFDQFEPAEPVEDTPMQWFEGWLIWLNPEMAMWFTQQGGEGEDSAQGAAGGLGGLRRR
jgi:hypothetical protein